MANRMTKLMAAVGYADSEVCSLPLGFSGFGGFSRFAGFQAFRTITWMAT